MSVVVSHPSRKNKNAARVGHPAVEYCGIPGPQMRGTWAPRVFGDRRGLNADSVGVKTLTYQPRGLISENLQGFNGPFWLQNRSVQRRLL